MNLRDDQLVFNIQREFEAEKCLLELVNRHSGIFYDIVNRYVPVDSDICSRDDLFDDRNFYIYSAALKYKSDKGTKFSTFLGNETKWLCLNSYNKAKRKNCVNKTPEIDLVYYRTLETKIKGETFKNNTTDKEFPCLDHCLNSLRIINSPHCQPMWRRSIHDRFGMFNDSLMSAGDYEMWLRSVDGGAKMKKIDKVLGLYFRNPDGVSTSSKTLQKALFEVNQVKNQYSRSYI